MPLAYEWTKKRGAYYNFFLSWLRETFAAEAHANEGRGGIKQPTTALGNPTLAMGKAWSADVVILPAWSRAIADRNGDKSCAVGSASESGVGDGDAGHATCTEV